jgi:bifunctional enzyme CysN/CysC
MPQTRRHSYIVSLLGIRHVIVAINKMDLVDYAQDAFDRIAREYHDFASRLEFGDVTYLPLSALKGDNVVEPSAAMPWYRGATLMHLLETVHIAAERNLKDLRLPVQLVMRPDHTFRGFAGTLASGVLRRGATVAVMPSGQRSTVTSIETFDGPLEEAVAPMAVTVTLADEIDVSRGDMLVDPEHAPLSTHDFEAMVVWMAEEPMVLGKEYLLKHTTQLVGGRITAVRYGVDVNTMEHVEAAALALNQIGRCVIETNRALYFDAYRRNRTTGAFILVDRVTNRTVAAAMIAEGVAPRSYWDAEPAITEPAPKPPVTRAEHEARLGQRAVTLLLTGLTGSGKTTLAQAVERRLFDAGRTALVWDGVAMRRGIAKDLGYSDRDRSENVRRFAEVAGMLNAAGLVVIGALIAPRDDVRRRAAALVGEDRFLTVHLECPVAVCRERDQRLKGLYAKADAREIPDFAGVSSAYEPPAEPELVLDTSTLTVDACVAQILALLQAHGVPTG